MLCKLCFFRVKKTKVKFKRCSSRARIPTKATPVTACFDVYSSRSVKLEPDVTRAIETDFGLKFPKKYFVRLYPRSGLSFKPIFLGGDVTDSDHRGNICIILTNIFQRTIEIETCDRTAQMDFFKNRGG